MRQDIRDLRKSVDIVIVVLHKGMLRIPAKIAEYERIVSRAAIDEGADAIVGHHAHILRGIEFYKGKPIYHGINHFVIVYADPNNATIAQGTGINMHDRHSFRKAWREPPPNDRDPHSNFRYSADARNTMIVSLDVTKQGITSAGFIPCWINTEEQPEVVEQGTPRGEEVIDYIRSISEAMGSNVKFAWSGKKVIISGGD